MNPSMESLPARALSMVYGICCMFVHCMPEPLVMQTLLLPFRLCQIVDLAVRNGCSKVLMSVWWHWHCCNRLSLRTCASMVQCRPCSCNCPAVAKQLRMNCFDDLFVPTDMVQFSIQFSFVQSMPHSGSDSRLWIQRVCAFTH